MKDQTNDDDWPTVEEIDALISNLREATEGSTAQEVMIAVSGFLSDMIVCEASFRNPDGAHDASHHALDYFTDATHEIICGLFQGEDTPNHAFIHEEEQGKVH